MVAGATTYALSPLTSTCRGSPERDAVPGSAEVLAFGENVGPPVLGGGRSAYERRHPRESAGAARPLPSPPGHQLSKGSTYRRTPAMRHRNQAQPGSAPLKKS